MPSQGVVLLPVSEDGLQLAGRRPGSHRTVIQTRFLDERAGLPAHHARRRDRCPVDSAARDRNVTSNLLEALASEQLTRARNVFDVREPIVVVTAVLYEWGTSNAKPSVSFELFEQELEVA